MAKRRLILTIIHNYELPLLEPFIKSLKKTDFDGDLIAFTSETISKTTRFFLKKNGVQLILFNQKYPFIQKYLPVLENITESISINNYRFLLFLHFLRNNSEVYDKVILTDIRDVVFQSNPFGFINRNKIYFFLENQTFSNSELNYKWYKEAFDLESANSVLNKTVSCAGIIMGGTIPMIEYLEYVRKKLQHKNDLKWGIDQGIHNGYIYKENNNNLEIIPNTHPFVFTAGASLKYQLNSKGLLVNEHNEIYLMVHQYDRIRPLFLFIKRRYLGSRLTQIFKRALFACLP